MNFQSIFISTYVVIICIVTMPSCHVTAEAKNNTIGFSVDLIHRDSPLSPGYDSSLSSSQRLSNMLRRSFTRINNRFNPNYSEKTGPVSDVIIGSLEYLMTYSIGTPAVRSLGVLDTGSDLTWTQCKTCVECFKQKLPLFDPENSSTYNIVPCSSNSCKIVQEPANCDMLNKTCLFEVSYGDGSFASGNVATDTLTLGSTSPGINVSVPNFIFGCAHKAGGLFDSGESGIVGLGAGKASLVSQLGSSIEGKFSYCLVPLSSIATKSSKLNFGNNAVVLGEGLVTTPMVLKLNKSFYYLTLEAISVDNERFEFYDDDDPLYKTEGNMFIDSGTTLTIIPTNLYEKVENAVEKTIKLKRVKDPLQTFRLCYSTKTEIRFPVITVHFKGADVKLNPENAFFKTDDSTRCLAFEPIDGPISIYGNVAQMNFLIGYDLEKKTVSFKPTDCTKS